MVARVEVRFPHVICGRQLQAHDRLQAVDPRPRLPEERSGPRKQDPGDWVRINQ
eukprot:CAMPEP_0180516390 /NCGR_PEP_ID=MMETSP1036_2-20121128/53891_1 /TAXON_ID=632150 /ORGANISM="Azadinium spinosum, Strain 3D9" /LENGTH=53 /DNA_ID=CAMNT_0022528183 /DNA_START=347 /DNA_END=508 /DNA_ORIENTATION=+